MTSTNRGARAVLLLPAFLLVAALAACAPTATPATHSASAAQHTAEPTPVTSQHLAFGGDCSALVSVADVTSDVGTTVALSGLDPWLDFTQWVVPAVGGTWCVWNASNNSHAQSVDVIVLPASAASSASYPASTCTADGDGDLGDCGFNVVDSGYWFSGEVGLDFGSTVAQARAATARLEAQLQASAASAGKAPAIVAVTGAWAKPASCASLDAAGAVSTSLGSPTLVLASDDALMENGNPDAYTAALAAAPYLACEWQTTPNGDDRAFSVYLYPGGASSKSHLISSKSVAVTVPGADSAYVSPGIEGTKTFDVFAGTNAFVIDSNASDITAAQFTGIAMAVLKGMG
ncbi:MAG TPA: hypothetical protein VHZ81_07585 [Galbitalea sp.]|jgi:hypothetical protein|nr:hypothetical protein [Galbitalea sp.]